MKKVKTYTVREIAEAHVIPAEITKEEQKKSDLEFSAFRRKQLALISEKDRINSRLLQLRFRMEDCISDDSDKAKLTFGDFLEEYIRDLNLRQVDFSREIGLHVTKLSRLLNNREDPSEKIFVRLELHSGNIIPAVVWLKLFQKQKAGQLQEDWQLREKESTYVKKPGKLVKM